MAYNVYAGDMLDGEYQFRATVKESNSNEQYPFKMNLDINNSHISGRVNYFNDNCSGLIKGKVLPNNKIQLSETIIEGSNICANGTHLYDLKHQIISKAKSYTLENHQHNVIINKYDFTPNPSIWNNVVLKNEINETKIDIKELEDQLIKPRESIKKAKKKKNQAQYSLDHNHTEAYQNGQCITPPLATPKPEPFYDTEEKAKHSALAYCSVSFGCRVGVELARDKLDTGAKRFLASQSCTLMVRNYQEKGTLIDETMFNLLDAVSYAGCDDKSDGFFSAIVQGGSCVMSAATRLARVGQYIGCIDYKTQEFHNTYLDWKNAPEKQKKECDTHLQIVNEIPSIVAKYNEEISEIESAIDTENNELVQLKNELKKILVLREKQSELIKVLTK